MVRAKERALLDLVKAERAKRRKVWVYVQYTDKHDVEARLEKLLKEEEFRVGVLRASVPLARREEWIAQHAPQLDVVISHPRLVETGLDLFDKGGRHNFPTITFYEALCGAPHKASYVASAIMWRSSFLPRCVSTALLSYAT